jgi:hypothetical protein
MAGLSKSRILLHRQCPKRLWLQTYRKELIEESGASIRRMNAGSQVGEVARSLYPDGALIDTDDLREALKQTRVAMDNGPRPLFEATFEFERLLIRADLMLPEGEAYRMVEVKSSASVKPYHLEDAAIQNWVANKAGVVISRTEVAHIDTSFVYPGGGRYAGLFKFVDVSAEVDGFAAEVPSWVDKARRTLDGEEPDITPGPQCSTPFECPLIGYCNPVKNPGGYPVSILPYGGNLTAELIEAGYEDLRDVPADRITKPKHQRVWRVSKSGKAELDAAAGELIRRMDYPRYYLDFETINPAVPVWANTRPYMQVPFQWSCHIEHADGTLEHHAFLAEGGDDPRRGFSESLVKVLGESGPVVVYNAAFERSRMQEMAEAFPELAPALEVACKRIVDLLPIAREHYYHPEMRGSWSIKDVLRTIAPDLAYEGMAVADGGMAQEAFAELMQPDIVPERRKALRDALLEYCERDTLAMVRIAHYFSNGI